MSKTNSGSNGRKKLFVVGGKTAEQLEQEAERIKMNAHYLKWIRTTANDHQILELRNELRERRASMTHNVEQHEILQREFLTLQRMLCHCLWHLANGGCIPFEMEVTNDDLNKTIGGLHLQIDLNEDETGWILSLKEAKGTEDQGV